MDDFIQKRQAIAAAYDEAFADVSAVHVPMVRENVSHAYHLYPILLNLDALTVDRKTVFEALRAEGIGVNVHYIPVYWHPHYQSLGYKRGLCPIAEQAYERLISLPIFPEMTDDDCDDVIAAVNKVVTAYQRR